MDSKNNDMINADNAVQIDDALSNHNPQSKNQNWVKAILPAVLIALCAELGTAILNNSTLPVYYTIGLTIPTFIYTIILVPFFISEALFKSPLGVLSDRLGRKPLVLFGCVMTIITPLIVKSMPFQLIPRIDGHPVIPSIDYLPLVVFGFLRLMDGLGGAAMWPALFAYIGDQVAEDKRGAAMGLLNAVYMIGLALSFLIGGAINDALDPVLTGTNSLRTQLHIFAQHLFKPHAPYTKAILDAAMSNRTHYYPSFYLASILFAAATLLCLLGMRNLKSRNDGHAEDGEKVTWASFKSAIRRIPEYIGLAFTTFFGIGCIALIVKIFALKEFKLSEEQVGILMLYPTLMIAILAVPLGHLGDKWGKANAIKLGFIICSIGLWGIPILTMMHVKGDVGFVLTAALMGLGFVIAFPAWNAQLTSLSDESHRGTVLGAVSTAQGTGVLLGGLAGGALFDKMHILPFIVSASIVTLSTILAFVYIKDGRKI